MLSIDLTFERVTYVYYFTENYLLIMSDLCPSNGLIVMILKAMSPYPLYRVILQ